MRKGGNPNLWKSGFKKGDPRINRKGAPKKMPAMKLLMEALLGSVDGDITKSRIADVVESLIDETKNRRLGSQRVMAAKELLERAYGKVKAVDDVAITQPIIWNEEKTYLKK